MVPIILQVLNLVLVVVLFLNQVLVLDKVLAWTSNLVWESGIQKMINMKIIRRQIRSAQHVSKVLIGRKKSGLIWDNV